jgi:hypothetical protein
MPAADPVGRPVGRTWGVSFNWRFCLAIGLLVALVDFVGLMLGRGQPPTSEARAMVELVALVANVMLFSHVGFRTGQQTGRATAAAEAGVLASLLPAAAGVVYLVLLPTWVDSATDGLPLANQLVGHIAFNIVLGGLAAWLSGWMASIGRKRAS